MNTYSSNADYSNDFMNTRGVCSIDVVIPLYNAERYIVETLTSVVNQTRKPQRIIVINDGSTDNSPALVEAFAKRSHIPITLITKKNAGLSSARNAGIEESDADLIAFLDADDVWEKDKLELQAEKFERDPAAEIGLVYCKYDHIDTEGKVDTESYVVPLDKTIKGNVFEKLLEGNKILSSGSGVLIKREVFAKVGVFDDSFTNGTLSFGEDWDMWLRISEMFEVDYVDKVLVHIRKHKKSMTAETKNVFLGEIAFYNAWAEEIKGRYPIPRKWSDKIIFRILTRLPKTDFITIAHTKLSPYARKEFFKSSFGSLFLYAIVFIVRQGWSTLFSPEKRKLLKQEIKKQNK